MDYGSIPLLSAMKLQMMYLGQRQAVLAQNIANVDTPRYQARDVKAPDFHSTLKTALPLARTSPSHLASPNNKGVFKVENRYPAFETNPNGNNVSVEEEIQKVSMNSMDYQQITALYSKMISMFRTAIGQPGGSG